MVTDNFKESLKTRLRDNNVGLAIKHFQTQVNLQSEIENLLDNVEELQDKNSKLCKGFKKRLGKYEKELIEMGKIISDF